MGLCETCFVSPSTSEFGHASPDTTRGILLTKSRPSSTASTCTLGLPVVSLCFSLISEIHSSRREMTWRIQRAKASELRGRSISEPEDRDIMARIVEKREWESKLLPKLAKTDQGRGRGAGCKGGSGRGSGRRRQQRSSSGADNSEGKSASENRQPAAAASSAAPAPAAAAAAKSTKSPRGTKKGGRGGRG